MDATPNLTRRQLLNAAGAASVGSLLLPRSAAAATTPAVCAGLRKIKHIVILIQENRSFDNYFGSYKGVRGFDDRSAPRGAAAFRQSYPPQPTPTGYPNPMLPFHISTAVTPVPQQGACTNDVEHQWAGAHDSWHGGRWDNWMGSHLVTEPDAKQAAMTMAYYTRADLPFYYALADTFTICDNYFCSVIGGTDQNRLMSLTGTLDPDCWDGGGQFSDTITSAGIQSPGADLGTAGRWVPYPQVLSRAGISWKVYGTPDGQDGDNVLRYFPQYRPVGGDPALFQAAFGSQAFPADFAADCQAGTLPEVSWLVPGLLDSEHSPAPPEWGESVVHTVLTALTSSSLWQDTALFLTYDENGGLFDHVPPPTPPAGTPGEYFDRSKLSATCRTQMTTKKGVDESAGPIGLGARVPMLVISPWSRNPSPAGAPLVCTDRNDHTSLLRFIESWSFANGRPAPIPARNPHTRSPGLSPWRRAAVGDLTGAFSFDATPDASIPTALLSIVPNRADPAVLTECIITGTPGSEVSQTEPIVQDPPVPSTVAQPSQERFTGKVRHPQAGCATATTGHRTARPATSSVGGSGGGTGSGSSSAAGRGTLPATGLSGPAAWVATATLGLAGAVLARRNKGLSGPEDRGTGAR